MMPPSLLKPWYGKRWCEVAVLEKTRASKATARVSGVVGRGTGLYLVGWE
jgi:hypothetical protein